MKLLELKVQAGTKENAVIPLPDGSFKVRTTAVREKGKANQSVIKLMAEYLGVPKSSLSIISGQSSSKKRIRVE